MGNVGLSLKFLHQMSPCSWVSLACSATIKPHLSLNFRDYPSDSSIFTFFLRFALQSVNPKLIVVRKRSLRDRLSSPPLLFGTITFSKSRNQNNNATRRLRSTDRWRWRGQSRNRIWRTGRYSPTSIHEIHVRRLRKSCHFEQRRSHPM